MDTQEVVVVWSNGTKTAFYPQEPIRSNKGGTILVTAEGDGTVSLNCESGFRLKGEHAESVDKHTVTLSHFNFRMIQYTEDTEEDDE